MQESPELWVDFIHVDGNVYSRAPFTPDGVCNAARRLAEMKYSLMDERGRHWIWHQCYDVLVETETRRIVIVDSIPDHVGTDNHKIWLKRTEARRKLIRDRANDTAFDLVHKDRGQQYTVEEEEEL
jgi:hypothetical protein